MSPDLPPQLQQAIRSLLEGVSRADLAARSDRISLAYRDGVPSVEAIDSKADVLAYVVARMPATYAALVHVFSEICDRAPRFAPKRLLDVGAGPGTASWAAIEAWPALAHVWLMDERAIFLDLAQQLARSGSPPLMHSERINLDLTRPAHLPPGDLVVASYFLAEIPEARIAELTEFLWRACGGMFVVIEPGTPAGHRRILSVRDVLLARGARLVAPCPHEQACPLQPPDWCHFSQRLARSRDHKLAKSAVVPFEDEKFSYLVAARASISFQAASARVLGPTTKSKAGIELKLCEQGRVVSRAVPRRDKDAYAHHRHARWGDAF